MKKCIHLKLCLATAIHNFKWVKITHDICLIWDQTFENLHVQTSICWTDCSPMSVATFFTPWWRRSSPVIYYIALILRSVYASRPRATDFISCCKDPKSCKYNIVPLLFVWTRVAVAHEWSRPRTIQNICNREWLLTTLATDFYPSAIKAVGYSDHQRRAGGRSEIQLLLKS